MSTTKAYWSLVLDDLATKISQSQYQAWFSKLRFVETVNKGRKLILQINSKFSRDYIQRKFAKELQDSISKYYPQVVHIDYEITADENQRKGFTDQDNKLSPASILDPLPVAKKDNSVNKDQAETNLDEKNSISSLDRNKLKNLSLNAKKHAGSNLPNKSLTYLNPRYNFDNFIVTQNTELAVSVSKSILKKPGKQYNPLFIYSNVGLGKTHLLQAIGAAYLDNYPSKRIRYATCETFCNHYINSVLNNTQSDFQEYFREVDLLLIDDIQFLAGKSGSQQAFFHTFNELYQLNKQIILTSDKSPEALDGVEKRLVSRFQSGMLIDIPQPEFEDRLGIVQAKSQVLGLAITPEQAGEIALKVDTNVRDLQGVLNNLKAYQDLTPGSLIKDEQINRVLQKFGRSVVNINLSPETEISASSLDSPKEKILKTVCSYFEVSVKQIKGKTRSKNVVCARQVVMYLLKTKLDYSFPVIAKILGGRDHTTIMHGYRKIKNLQENDPGHPTCKGLQIIEAKVKY